MSEKSLLVLLITLFAGMYFIQSQTYSFPNEKFLNWFFFILMLIPNVAFFIHWIYQVRIEILIYYYDKSRFKFKLFSCFLMKRTYF